VLQRPRVLDPGETPDQELIVHRGAELHDVAAAIQGMRRGRSPVPFIVYGPPGTGKTMVAAHVCRRDLEGVPTAYVDCWTSYDEHHLLADVVDGLDLLRVVHRNSTPTSDLRDALQKAPDKPRVVVLDELEMVHDPEPLEVLANAPDLAVVGIVNDPDEVRDRLANVWGGIGDKQFLQFGAYSVRRVAAIVAKRAEYGLRGSPLSDAQAERIGELADGDARLGIATLRAAAHHAGVDAATITDDDVEAGARTAREELHQATLERLTDHQTTLYTIVRERGASSPSELYDAYCEEVDTPRSKRAAVTYLRKMCQYGLLEAEGTTRDRTYRLDSTGYTPVDA
jgi:Cdc6-like AAA superfamily ATPase